MIKLRVPESKNPKKKIKSFLYGLSARKVDIEEKLIARGRYEWHSEFKNRSLPSLGFIFQ